MSSKQVNIGAHPEKAIIIAVPGSHIGLLEPGYPDEPFAKRPYSSTSDS